MERLGVRGLSCPAPVLRVRQALKNKDELLVLLDSQIALENVKRMAQNMGLIIELEEKNDEYELSLKK